MVGSRSPQGRLTWQTYWANAVDIPSPATEALGAAARQAQAYLVMGVIERDTQFSRGTLYCTLLYFDPEGQADRQAPQAQADRRRAPDLGRGRRQHADRVRYGIWQAGRA